MAGQIVDQDGNYQHDQAACANRHQGKPPAQCMIVVAAGNGNQRRGGPRGADRYCHAPRAAQRQPTAMTDAAVAAQIHQTLDIHVDFPAQIALRGNLGDLGADRGAGGLDIARARGCASAGVSG